MNRPVTRVIPRGQRRALEAIFRRRGHALAKNPKNRYIAFEVRTPERSIFTLYTSGKLVSTVRAGDAEGVLLEGQLAPLLGQPAAPREPAAALVAEGSAKLLLGADETGTGELLGAAIVGACLLPGDLAPGASAVAGHVETKSSRAASGWQKLAERLAGLRAEGLLCTAVTIPNRLFDRYSKNGLLDMAYIRAVADLLSASQQTQEDGWNGMQIVLDDYGVGRQLSRAVEGWRQRGADVRVETKADDHHLAPRLASVWARAARSREMVGLSGEVDDGPLGSGNAGHRLTLAWLRRRAAGTAGWPSFVKTSFKTVRSLDGLEPVTKRPVPALEQLLDEGSAAALLQGSLDLSTVRLRYPSGTLCSGLRVDLAGRWLDNSQPPPGAEFLPLLFGGLVFDAEQLSLEQLDRLLDRERGLASGWRLLVGPDRDPQDPRTVSLARAHAAGVVQLQPTEVVDPRQRAEAHGALLLTSATEESSFHLLLRSDS